MGFRAGLRTDLRAGLRTVLGCALAAGLGCASQRLEISLAKSQPHRIRLIAVYPPALHFEAPAYRSYELAMDQVEAVLATGHFMALGPDEFKQLDWPSNFLYASTNLSGKLTPLGLAPPEVVGLRAEIERREQHGSQQLYDAQGRPRGRGRSAELTYEVRAELLGPDSDEPLAVGSIEIAADPFAEHPAWDDAPELRQAVKTLIAKLLRRADASLQPTTQVTRLPFEADWIPWGEEQFAMPGRPALREQLASLDAVSAEAARLLRLSYFEADLPSARQSAMLSRAPGLWVTDLPGRLREAGLQAGDLITHIEGEPAAGPQTFLRWASAKPAGSLLSIDVQRGDQLVHLKLPAPGR